MNKVVLSAILLICSSAWAQADAIEDKYNKTCVVCHAAGAAGAPKTGVPSEWEDRLAKGMDALVQAVDKGMNAMPPKGMCFDCSAEDFQALIEYMVKPK